MIRIEHVALWVRDLERAHAFYAAYFGMAAGVKYHNPTKGFTSYFLSSPGGGPRLELMHHAGRDAQASTATRVGYDHIAISVGSRADVDGLTERLRADGYAVVGEPRVTGDGYYESVVLDGEGNRVEITA